MQKRVVVLVAFSLAGALVGKAAAAATGAHSARERELEALVLELAGQVRLLTERVSELERRMEGNGGASRRQISFESDRGRSQIHDSGPASVEGLRASWDEGLHLESATRSIELQIGGRIMNDWAFFAAERPLEDTVGSLENGAGFRRARLFVSGVLGERVEFKSQFDFAGGRPVFKDVYVGVIGLPRIGEIRVGHFKEPFGLEGQTSSKFLTMMELSLAGAFSPPRNTGVMVRNRARGDRLTWAAGAFLDSDDFGDSSQNDQFNLTGRVTGLPWYREGGERLVHLGLGLSRRDPRDDVLRIAQGPGSHLAPDFLDARIDGASAVHLADLEGVLLLGPLSLQGELTGAWVNRTTGPNVRFSGYYVQASYFFTGEHRNYEPEEASFGRVGPRSPFLARGGIGAWEIAARYSEIDLDDRDLRGGSLDNLTLGINWHLNPHTRFMVNYVLSDLHAVGGARVFQTRFQLDF